MHGIDDGTLGLLLALVPIMAGVGSALAGVLTERFSSKPVLRVAGPIVPIMVVAAGWAPNMGVLIAALAVLGVGLGATDATMNMQAVAAQFAYGRSIISSCYAWFSVASIVGAILAALFAATAAPLWLFFGMCALIVVPIHIVLGSSLFADAKLTSFDAKPHRVPWLPIIAIGVALMCAYVLDSATQNWSAVYLTDTLKQPESIAALGYAVYSLLLLTGRTFVDRWNRRYGARVLVTAGGILAIASMLLVAIAPNAAVAFLGFALLGLAVAPMIPLAFIAAASHDQHTTGKAVARVNIFNYAGVLLGAPIIGLIADVSSLRIAFASMALAGVVVLVLARRFTPARYEDAVASSSSY